MNEQERGEMFISWLATRVAPERFASLYAELRDIEAWCRDKGLLNNSLFEADDSDAVAAVRLAGKKRYLMPFLHRQDLADTGEVLLDYYEEFLKEPSASSPNPQAEESGAQMAAQADPAADGAADSEACMPAEAPGQEDSAGIVEQLDAPAPAAAVSETPAADDERNTVGKPGTQQPRRDIYEAVILLDGYLEARKGMTPRQQVEQRISAQLRRMAVNRGVSVDSVYRNEAGIAFRMRSMESAYKGDTVKGVSATKLFTETVDLYRNDQEKFLEILARAKNMLSPQQPTTSVLINARDVQHPDRGENEQNQADSRDTARRPVTDVPLYQNTLAKYYKNGFDPMAADAYSTFREHFREANPGKAPAKVDMALWAMIRRTGVERYGKIYPKTEDTLQPAPAAPEPYRAVSETQPARVDLQPRRPNPPSVPENRENPTRFRPAADPTYQRVLEAKFKNGFRLDSTIDFNKFKKMYDEINGQEIICDIATLKQRIRRTGIEHDGKVYPASALLSDGLKDKILDFIRRCFNAGKNCVYYQAIYDRFHDELLDSGSSINGAEMMRSCLAALEQNRDLFYAYGDYLAKEPSSQPDIAAELRECLQNTGLPLTYEQLHEQLPHLPRDKIRQTLGSRKEFIYNGGDKYFHASVMHLREEELEQIARIIDRAIETDECISGAKLYDEVQKRFPEITENNQMFSVTGFRDALKYKFGERFSFTGKVISCGGQPLSTREVFEKFAKRDKFTASDLKELTDELDLSSPNYEAVYRHSFRVNETDFVSRAGANESFPVDETDAALDRICQKDGISIREAASNPSVFPEAKWPWNEYLLESYAALFSKKFTLLHSNFAATGCPGVIARHGSFADFDEFLAAFLAKSDVDLKDKPALDLLVEKGFLLRRNYSKINNVIARATAMRHANKKTR